MFFSLSPCFSLFADLLFLCTLILFIFPGTVLLVVLFWSGFYFGARDLLCFSGSLFCIFMLLLFPLCFLTLIFTLSTFFNC